MKNMLKFLSVVLLFPISGFPIHPLLNNANQYFRSSDYQKAYTEFSWFLFQNGRGCADEDYYVALIGRNSCMKYLDAEDMFYVERQFFAELLDVTLPQEQEDLLVKVIKNSVYWDFEE